MLRVTVELVPHGEEDRAYTIGTMLIANDGTGSLGYGNYGFAYCNTDNDNVIAIGTLQNFPRHLGAWQLIKRALSIKNSESNHVTDILGERLKQYKED